MKEQIDWDPFVPWVKRVFHNDTSKGKAGVDELIWEGLQQQLNLKGYEIKTGVIQDAGER